MAHDPNKRYERRREPSALQKEWGGKVVTTLAGRVGHVLVDDQDQLRVMWESHAPDGPEAMDPATILADGWLVQTNAQWQSERRRTKSRLTPRTLPGRVADTAGDT